MGITASAEAPSATIPPGAGHSAFPKDAKDCRACSGVMQMMNSFSRVAHGGKSTSSPAGSTLAEREFASMSQSANTTGQPSTSGAHMYDQGHSIGTQGRQQQEGSGASAEAGSSAHARFKAAAVADVATSASASAAAEASEQVAAPAVECPPETSELGHATWTFLHTMAAYYPESPSDAQQALMRATMSGLAEFYPCSVCAEHLKEQFKASPPQVASNQDLSMWLCKIHNEVNEMLGKPAFDCSKVFERWRDGPADGSCW